jgi:hypothetical protein
LPDQVAAESGAAQALLPEGGAGNCSCPLSTENANSSCPDSGRSSQDQAACMEEQQEQPQPQPQQHISRASRRPATAASSSRFHGGKCLQPQQWQQLFHQQWSPPGEVLLAMSHPAEPIGHAQHRWATLP